MWLQITFSFYLTFKFLCIPIHIKRFQNWYKFSIKKVNSILKYNNITISNNIEKISRKKKKKIGRLFR